MKHFPLYIILIAAPFLFATGEIGMMIGSPTGLSYKNQLGSATALEFQLGWSFEKNSFDLHGAYLFAQRSNIIIEDYNMPFYFGPGGRIRYEEYKVDKKAGNIIIGTDTKQRWVLSFKFPFGLYYKFRNVPFSMFGEIAPGMDLYEETDFVLMGGIGFRYVFGQSSKSEKEPAGGPSEPRRERR